MSEKYNVIKRQGRYYPQRFDEDLGWVTYKQYEKFLSFGNPTDAWDHIKNNPNQLNVSCD